MYVICCHHLRPPLSSPLPCFGWSFPQDGDWEFVGKVVAEARAEGRGVVSECEVEVAAAAAELEYRSLMPALQSATAALDEAALATLIDRAKALALQEHPSDMVRGVVANAHVAVGRIDSCKQRLAAAVAAVSLSELTEATEFAASIGYHAEDVDSARALLQRVQAVVTQAERVLAVVDREGIEAAMAAAEALGLQLPQAEEMQRVLDLSPDDLLHRQLATAVAAGNQPLVVELTMRIKVSTGPGRGAYGMVGIGEGLGCCGLGAWCALAGWCAADGLCAGLIVAPVETRVWAWKGEGRK